MKDDKYIWNDSWRNHKVKVITMISIMIIIASIILIGIKSLKPSNTMMPTGGSSDTIDNNWMWTQII